MNKWQLYIKIKAMLCEHGAIPDTEEQYERLIDELLNLYTRIATCSNCRPTDHK